MSELKKQSLEIANSTSDLVAECRRETIVRLGQIAVPLILPFLALSFYQQAYVRGCLVAAVALSLTMNTRRTQQRRPLFLAQEHLYLLMLVLCAYAFKEIDVLVTFWCYPIPLYFLFTVPRRLSDLVGVTWWVFVTSNCLVYFEPKMTLRISASLLLVLLSGRAFMRIIERLQDNLILKARTDNLTGLLNRQSLANSLALSRERKNRGLETSSIILVDLDDFKEVNDQFGHGEGDRVLKEVASLIKNRLRRIDAAFRYGGEEFLIVLSAADLEQAHTVAESLRQLLHENCHLPDGRRVTGSFGVAEICLEESDDRWIQKADLALYRAKGKGRNTVCRWTEAENLSSSDLDCLCP